MVDDSLVPRLSALTNLSSACPVAFIWRVGTGVCKTPYLRFISADVHKYWFTASIIPYLCAAPCPVFRANPQPERESDIGAPVDRLPAPVQLSRVYLRHSRAIISQAFHLLPWKAWERGYSTVIGESKSIIFGGIAE